MIHRALGRRGKNGQSHTGGGDKEASWKGQNWSLRLERGGTEMDKGEVSRAAQALQAWKNYLR